MFNSTKHILGLAVFSALVAAGLYWWWTRLVVGTFAVCVSGDPPVGTDCLHGFQFYGALAFAALAAVLMVVAIVRSVRSRRASRLNPDSRS